jgi:hypothetical protein
MYLSRIDFFHLYLHLASHFGSIATDAKLKRHENIFYVHFFAVVSHNLKQQQPNFIFLNFSHFPPKYPHCVSVSVCS